MKCTCYIKEDDGVEPQIIKCSLCKSATAIYEALEHLVMAYDITDLKVAARDIYDYPICWSNALKALSKAGDK